MREWCKKAGLVTLGSGIQGLGMGLFLFPQSIPSGGAGGLAILLQYFFHVPVGLALWLVNFFLLLFGVNYLGKRFAVWTVVGMTMASFTIDFVEHATIFAQHNVFFDLVIGSILLGLGIGILMSQGVSNGGVGVLAYMIAFKTNISPGKPLFYINSSIFLFTAMMIDWTIVFLAFISQWIATQLVDLVYHNNRIIVYTLDWRKKI